jgi:transcriptional regulator with GAF, ATPase, and Fis domain
MLAQQEREMILNTLKETGWNQSAAARILGIKRETLRYRMQKFGLSSASD